MIDPAGQRVGVQVKRYRNRIKVEQIRSFAGALLLGQYTKGVFVTTSAFQSGARKAAQLSEERGIAIELIDWKRFYEALKISDRPEYSSFEEWQHITGRIKVPSIDFFHA